MREYFRAKILFVVILLTAAILCGCEANDDINTKQREFTIRFLEGSHTPKLIAESGLASSQEVDPPFYTVYPAYIYRYIATYYDVDRDTRAEITPSSKVTLSFDLYEFTGSAIATNELPIYTNRAEDEQRLIDAGLNTEVWSFEPMTLSMGSGALLPSIEEALVGCREGDEVEIYLTTQEAYGSKIIGVIEKDSALRFTSTIEVVEN